MLFKILSKSNNEKKKCLEVPEFPFLAPITHGKVNQLTIAGERLKEFLKMEKALSSKKILDFGNQVNF